jgi:poly(A) polymerase
MKKCLNNKIFQIISNIASDEGLEIYVVGGFVRDCMLERIRQNTDIDIVVVGSGIELAKKVADTIGKETPLTVYKNYGTAMLKYCDTDIEFVGARRESYHRDSRKPVVEDGTLKDDQLRRDFTINAMAIGLFGDQYGELVDPFNGMDDLENKIIQTPLDPDITFSDDPLRMIRAIRFACQLGFEIHPDTFQALGRNKERIKIVSEERISDELNKIMMADKPSVGFDLLEKSGLLAVIFPAIQALKGVEEVDGIRHKDNFYHTIKVLDNLSKNTDNLWLRWAALLHDIAKPKTKKFEPGIGWTFHAHEFIGAKMIPGLFRSLRLPLNEKMKYVQKLVKLHLRPIVLSQEVVTDSAVRRLIYDAGDDLEDLMMLCEADITSKNERTVKRHLNNFQLVRQKMVELEEKDSIRNFQPPVSGEDIMRIFQLPPSKPVGIIKDAIKDAIIDGEIPNDYDAAYQFMLKKAKEIGLEPDQGSG